MSEPSQTPEEPKKEGWAKLSNSRKWHYFKDGASLCGTWLAPWITHYDLGNDASTDNCLACRKAKLGIECPL